MEWNERFIYKGQPLYYNRIGINNCSERSVEIPIAFNFLVNLAKKEKILEVGNVLANYENSLSEYLGLRPRRIVDKFEIDTGVDNLDLMDLPSEDKYDAIISISTVEHIGQSIAPAEAYGEQATVRDLEAPLKAIVKIYDILNLGGKALITVPFGKLTDGEWYIQFGQEYLDLLETKYNIPKAAISKIFIKRIALDIRKINTNNPRQIWREQREINQLANTQYNWPWPYANSLSILEIIKLEEIDYQKYDDYPETNLNYQKAIPTPTIYAELLEPKFLSILDQLRKLNIFVKFDYCVANENVLFSNLSKLVLEVFNHPDRGCICLLIKINNISHEEANLILSNVFFNIFMKFNFDVTDGAVILLLEPLNNVQWSALLPSISYRLVLENENIDDLNELKTEEMHCCSFEYFKNNRIAQSDQGSWILK